MARDGARLSCLLIVSAFVFGCALADGDQLPPEFYDITQDAVNATRDNATNTVYFKVRGRNIYHGMVVKASKDKSQRNSLCKDLNAPYNVTEISTGIKWGEYELTVPKDVQGEVFLCLPHQIKDSGPVQIPPSIFKSELYHWYHQGPDIFVNFSTADAANKTIPAPAARATPPAPRLHPLDHRERREEDDGHAPVRITGIRTEATEKEADFDEAGVPSVLADATHTFRLFGENLSENLTLAFTTQPGTYGESCYRQVSDGFQVEAGSLVDNKTALLKLKLPALPDGAESFYMCLKEGSLLQNAPYIHQGSEPWLRLKTWTKLVPIWAAICIIIICLMFSSLFSGLNLGLMSLDKTELKILCNTGTATERKYANIIQPVRNHGNYLLCAILLGNVFVNSIFTILLDDLTSGLIAVIFSTLAIVIFGEISPQAVCSRHGLWIGAKTIYITKFIMILSFPLAYPIAKFLDCVLGEEIGNVYTRERLKELVMVTTGENDLDRDEVNIISGALELRKKSVAEVMTKIEDVFMLDYEAVLDFETVSEIMKSGFSRIPVYEGNRQNVVTILYIKDLAFVDPDDNTPLKTLCQFYQNPVNFVFDDVTLDVMFKIFKEGNKGHMAFVHRVNNEGEGDPFYETIGLITLEDVIEELIQAEIMDETDVFTDNRSKRKRLIAERRQDFSIFAEKRGEQNRVRMSPQLTLAAFQYLSTSVEPFHTNVISETILRRLLKQDIVFHIKKNKEWRTDPANVIYVQGKAVDYFIIILEGRVEVTVGKENLVFEGGPFTYFGTQALVQTVGIESPVAPNAMGSLESLNIDSMLRHTFIPDYTVRATTEVLYLKVKRSLYLAAKRATLMERSKNRENQTTEQFDEEVDKLLHSLDEEEVVSAGRQTPRRKSSRNLARSQQELEGLQPPQRTPSHHSNASPSGGHHHHRLSKGDPNGALRSAGGGGGGGDGPVDEEAALLPKRA